MTWDLSWVTEPWHLDFFTQAVKEEQPIAEEQEEMALEEKEKEKQEEQQQTTRTTTAKKARLTHMDHKSAM